MRAAAYMNSIRLDACKLHRRYLLMFDLEAHAAVSAAKSTTRRTWQASLSTVQVIM
jgi:hypothetical protein